MHLAFHCALIVSNYSNQEYQKWIAMYIVKLTWLFTSSIKNFTFLYTEREKTQSWEISKIVISSKNSCLEVRWKSQNPSTPIKPVFQEKKLQTKTWRFNIVRQVKLKKKHDNCFVNYRKLEKAARTVTYE